jgi:hypothetical protein
LFHFDLELRTAFGFTRGVNDNELKKVTQKRDVSRIFDVNHAVNGKKNGALPNARRYGL